MQPSLTSTLYGKQVKQSSKQELHSELPKYGNVAVQRVDGVCRGKVEIEMWRVFWDY